MQSKKAQIKGTKEREHRHKRSPARPVTPDSSSAGLNAHAHIKAECPHQANQLSLMLTENFFDLFFLSSNLYR